MAVYEVALTLQWPLSPSVRDEVAVAPAAMSLKALLRHYSWLVKPHMDCMSIMSICHSAATR